MTSDKTSPKYDRISFLYLSPFNSENTLEFWKSLVKSDIFLSWDI